MKRFETLKKVAFLALLMVFFTGCEKDELNDQTFDKELSAKAQPPTVETAGNNLSFPVIWAENVAISTRVEPAEGPKLLGEWWYVWGTDPVDPNGTIYSCEPLVSDPCYPDGTTNVYRAYLQKDANNIWQAYNAAPPVGTTVIVDDIDWGDNLESGDWSLTSKIRVEVGLYENFIEPVKQYAMRHVSGWGTDEVHGLQTDLEGNIVYGPGLQATVYSPLARLTIQKLAENASTENLTWDATNHLWTGDVTSLVYNHAIYEGGTGPTFFGAEVNVKGKIIYGYAWDVRKMNAGAGTYRLTFSFDGTGNTDFDDTTKILVPEDEEVVVEAEPVGGEAQLDPELNITYIDINITGKATGGKGGGGNAGGGGNGGGNGGGHGRNN